MYDYGGFPAVVSVSKNGRGIEGELWEIDAGLLTQLDQLEGVDQGLYERSTVNLLAPNDQFPEVIIYLYLRDVAELPEVVARWPRELDFGP